MNRLRRFAAAFSSALFDPSRKLEIGLWIVVIAAVIGARIFLFELLPTYIWSSDSKSYLKSVFILLDEGQWQTQQRRGPAYSAFVAAAVLPANRLTAVVLLQHVLGAVSILSACALLRGWFGRRAMWPIAFAGVSYGLYALPNYLEQLIRNETLLFFFGSLALIGLALGLRSGRSAWYVLAGLSGIALSITKNIFLPYPLLVPLAIVYVFWGKWRLVLRQTGVFLAAYFVPMLLLQLYYSLAAEDDAPSSYAGVQLYGRVAQFTDLEGGLYPELKARIAPLVKEYRSRDKLDNNWVIKRGIVPEIAAFLGTSEGGKGLPVVDPVCRALAFEAIRTHRGPYAAQVWSDLNKLWFDMAFDSDVPESKSLTKLRTQLIKLDSGYAFMETERTVELYAKAAREDYFDKFHRLTRKAWLFEMWPPVFVTSLLLPLLILCSPRDRRGFWLVAAGLWFANLVLLATVGKPLHRYMMPFAPIMFLAFGSLLALLFGFLRRGVEMLGWPYQAISGPSSESSRSFDGAK